MTLVEKLACCAAVMFLLGIGGGITLLWPFFGWLCLIGAGILVVSALVLALVVIPFLDLDFPDEDGYYPGS